VNLSHLGTPVGPMTPVYGKSSNRIWRLETARGVFAVKELRVDQTPYLYKPNVALMSTGGASGVSTFNPLNWAFGGGEGIRTLGLYIANVRFTTF
jgi:hypothetical protein